jgi:hypothetical protein
VSAAHRLPDEGADAFEAFMIYAAMSRESRSIDKVATQINRPIGTVRSWANRAKWRARLKSIETPAPELQVERGGTMGSAQIEAILVPLLKTIAEDQERMPGTAIPRGASELVNAWRRAKTEEKKWGEAQGKDAEEQRRLDLSRLGDLQLATYELFYAITSGAIGPMTDEVFMGILRSGEGGIRRALLGAV